MDKRFQKTPGDMVLAITEQQPVTTRLSEKNLLRRKTYLTGAMSRFQAQLDQVNSQLDQLYAEAANH